ncbi:Acyl-CoA thioesterase [Penicillium paradoxum]|uniref:Acyl-CoA thioesterase n=1 Tax=Penicillium paradoxum TaxID=176176 RepID=UPI00254755C6|nr:Acyl-CoA thioesterase [Penicillium paradoxum]KAJ5773519.1 Acyl-CoA thioesterase [Penicillium paradoxum]
MSPQRGAPDNDGDEATSPRSFVSLMALERLEEIVITHPDATKPERIERFRSLSTPYNPGGGTRSFGGHVYAQSAYAASKTVSQGLVIHDMTGSFIRGGRLDVPYVYTVRHIRDGLMYSTRAVDARQAGKICFSCICSFKRDEKQRPFHHQPTSAQTRFDSILSAKRPEDQSSSPSVDAEWWIENVRQGNIAEHEFPGLDVRKTDMIGYNHAEEVKQHPERYRQLTQYRMIGSPDGNASASLAQIRQREEAGEYDNLYACAHMYSSDKNSLLLIPRALGIKHWTEMASLTLTVIVHQHGEALRMIDWDRVSDDDAGNGSELPMKWFVQEGWTPRAAENRAVHESHLWSPDGTLLATSLQDSLLRLRKLDAANL